MIFLGLLAAFVSGFVVGAVVVIMFTPDDYL